jgi:hypothetical protein
MKQLAMLLPLRFYLIICLSLYASIFCVVGESYAGYLGFEYGGTHLCDHGLSCEHGIYPAEQVAEGDLVPEGYALSGRSWGGSSTGTAGGLPSRPVGISISAVPAGSTPDPYSRGLTTNFSALFAGDELATVHAAFALWSVATGGMLVDLGTVPDNGAPFNSLPSDRRGLSGPFGDIRLFAVDITGPALAHAYYPPPTGRSGSGDIFFDNRVSWVDDPLDLRRDPDYDFFTVALHELGHALGLGHSRDSRSIMFPYYMGSRRSLTADDTAGIRAIYGYNDGSLPLIPLGQSPGVPEPTTLLLVGSGLVGLCLRRRRDT